jgi:hypothetical protein
VDVRVVAFEAWNISRFIFVTNKRREIAGASELITYLDRRWVHAALVRVFAGFDPTWRIEERPVELLAVGAGTVKVLVRDVDAARRLVTDVTLAALRDAPGLDVYGVVGEPFEWGTSTGLDAAVRAAVGGLGAARGARPGPDCRFGRLPVVDECATTSLPASAEAVQPGGGVEARSAESLAKVAAYRRTDEGDGLHRLADLAGTTPRTLGRVVEYLQDKADWVAVVYVDGNGLGDVLRDFSRLVDGASARAYADTLRAFTDGLDGCARGALAQALAAARDSPAGTAAGGTAPVLPLILGGDDVVLLCDGRLALPLTAEYLRAYEALTASRPEVSGPLRTANRPPVLSASAGIAIVKAHHPFESAAGLADELLMEAKQVKKHVPGPCSALAFHVLFDSTDARLERLRNGSSDGSNGDGSNGDGSDGGGSETGDGPYVVVAQPYVVSREVSGDGWLWGRRWEDLVRRVAAINDRDGDDERRLPAARLHELRQTLFAGPGVADARLANLLPRYGERGLNLLRGDGDSLFWAEPGGRRVTGLLDAMDAAQLWEG